jgi:hypothetical protein
VCVDFGSAENNRLRHRKVLVYLLDKASGATITLDDSIELMHIRAQDFILGDCNPVAGSRDERFDIPFDFFIKSGGTQHHLHVSDVSSNKGTVKEKG